MEPIDTTVNEQSDISSPQDTTETNTSPQTLSLSDRIRKERQRLGLSQAALAKLAGVHRKTQTSYELGQRKPDTDYLQALAGSGVDVGYVLTGESRREVEDVYCNVLDSISVVLGLHHGFEQEWQAVYEIFRADWRARWNDQAPPCGCDNVVRALLGKSPSVLRGADELAELVERVEFVAASAGISLSPQQKGRAIFFLFQEKRRLGDQPVDFGLVRRTLDQVT